MEARGKERNVALSQCEAPEFLTGPCQVTCKQVQILRPYLGEWQQGMPQIHFGGHWSGLWFAFASDLEH